MRHQKNKNKLSNKFIVGVLAVVILILAICAGVYASTGNIFGWNPIAKDVKSTEGSNPASQEQIEAGNSIKDTSVKNGGLSGSDQPQAPSPQSDGKQLVQVDITNVYKIENQTHVGVLISTIDSTGTCILTITSQTGSVLYTTSVGVQAMSNTSTCKGFDIPNSSLQDKFKITVDFKSGVKYGVATHDSL